jgi:uncharacterized 2Fe-2S/4Fe-4S cluster protein (DUF4445 family)
VFTQKDVRQLQLGKSAVYTGLQLLMRRSGIASDDIQRLYIAGGFGYNLNLISAERICLFPAALHKKIELVGNSALGGAVKYLLSNNAAEELGAVIDSATEFDLSADPLFNDMFVENLVFE